MSEPQHPPVPPSAQPHPLAGGPQHAVPQYAAAPNPAPQVVAPSYAPARPTGGEYLGRTALILAVIFLAFGLLKALAVPFAYIQSGYTPSAPACSSASATSSSSWGP